MSRPITFTIFCAPTKVKGPDGKTYRGAYPAGFLEMARKILVSCDPLASIWHIPGGCANNYNVHNLWGYGKNDKRIDLDPAVEPDFLCDVIRLSGHFKNSPMDEVYTTCTDMNLNTWTYKRPDAIIIDRDYDMEFSKHHAPGPDKWPSDLKKLFKDCMNIVKPAGLVGVFDFVALSPGQQFEQLFNISVMEGNKQVRCFSVWQNIEDRRRLSK